MSQYKDEGGLGFPGSVRRAREQAENGLPEDSRIGRPQAPLGLQGKNGQLAAAISRPSPMPQWPLPGSLQSPVSANSEPYRPPAGSRPPQRPPRPSVVPSILDSSRVQEHTPVFQYTPQDVRSSELSMADTIGSPGEGGSSRPLTQSSVGSIPDFPLPAAGGLQPPGGAARRSVNLGPPPSSRRGASSFYSTTSFVSPIPEESPRRSRASIASSAAIPHSFGTISPGYSPDGVYFDDTINEESVYGDAIEEKGLVRSASIGKRGKPSLVTTKNSDRADPMPRPDAKPLQGSGFRDGTGFLDGGSSSSGDGSLDRSKGGVALTTNTVLSAYEAASANDPAYVTSPKGRLSALRRPPRLDIDAVREAEARGSLTSLPDLIKRATRLAALKDKGRRPASRLDELMFSSEDVNARRERDFRDSEKYQSGLSDMLAAFPPPAATSRQSTRQSGTWPLGMSGGSAGSPMDNEKRRDGEENSPKKKRGCCCGLPKWAVFLIVLLLLCIVAAAVAVPLKLVVFKDNKTPTPAAALELCQNQVNCQNGGTNVINNGTCACICSNGFTGPTCTIASSQGCTTTTIMTGSTTGQVTLGQSIPRLLESAQRNFSIPLSASTILAKFSSSNLTCTTQNALVTFGGQGLTIDGALQQAAIPDTVPTITTVLPDLDLTLTLRASEVIITTLTQPTTLTGSFSTILTKVLTMSHGDMKPTGTPSATSSTMTPTRTSTQSSVTPAPTSIFEVNDTVLDFARVAVLFLLQETTLNQVASSQNLLQKFFTKASPMSNGVTVQEARKVDLGSGVTIDMVDFFINLGAGNVGGGPSASRRRRRSQCNGLV